MKMPSYQYRNSHCEDKIDGLVQLQCIRNGVTAVLREAIKMI